MNLVNVCIDAGKPLIVKDNDSIRMDGLMTSTTAQGQHNQRRTQPRDIYLPVSFIRLLRMAVQKTG